MSRSSFVTLMLCLLLAQPAPVHATDLDMVYAARQQAIDFRAQGRLEESLQAFNEAANRASRAFGARSSYVADIYFEEGLTAFKADQYSVAGKCLNKALEINPSSAQVHLKLAELNSLKGNFDVAKRHLRQVLSHDPKNLEARAILASCYQKEGDSGKATRAFSQMDHISRTGKLAANDSLLVFAPPPVDPALAAPIASVANIRLRPDQPDSTAAAASKAVAVPVSESKKANNNAKKVESSKADLAKAQALAITKKANAKKPDGKKGTGKKFENRAPANKKVEESEIVAGSANRSNTKLGSRVILLTPIKGARLAPVESTSSGDESDSDSQQTASSKKTKSLSPVAIAPRPKSPKRAGFVPPPPPVPVYGMMPVSAPPSAALQQTPSVNKSKPKSGEKPPKREEPAGTPDAGANDAEPDFLLDWGGKKKK